MYNRLISFVARNNILTEAQNGSRERRSTETVIHAFLENIQESIDKKANPTGIFFYLSKAYDVINHEMLLAKPSSYGVKRHNKLVVRIIPITPNHEFVMPLTRGSNHTYYIESKLLS
jgi:hypothetical protein